MLFLSADPSDVSRLRLGEEFREIQEKLQLSKERSRFKLEQRTSVRPADISQAMLDLQPQIVHFAGHGTSDGELCFENSSGSMHPISANAMATLFEQFSSNLECVILNACYSENQAKAISNHIKYVIGMAKEIGDKAAISFAIGFYQAIGAGRTIEDAYKLGCVQIRLMGIDESLTPILLTRVGGQQNISLKAHKPHLTDLLRLAERESNSGNFSLAIEILNKAHQLYPDDITLSSKIEKLRWRQKIASKLKEIEISYDLRMSTHSSHEAARSIYKGIGEILQETDETFPSQVKQGMLEILGDGYSRFSRENLRNQTKENINTFIAYKSEHWLVLPLVNLLEKWGELAYRISIEGAISSSRALGAFSEAYRLSRILLEQDPTDKRTVETYARCLDEFISSLNRSVEKRLLWAQEALDNGFFEAALENLNSLQEIYALIEREFPELLLGLDSIETQKKKADTIRKEAQRLKNSYEQANLNENSE